MIEALEGNRDAQLTLSLKQREKFYLPTTLQAMMNIKEEDAEDGEMGVVFFGEQEELFLAELKTVLEIFDELSITDACETGASIFAKSTQLNIQGFIGVNFNGK